VNIAPIQDKDLEFTVLKSILMFPDLRQYVYKLNKDDFYSLKSQDLFEYMYNTIAEDLPLEFTLLPRNFKYDEYYLPLMNLVPLKSNFKLYFTQLKELSNRRALAKMSSEILIKVQEGRKSDSIVSHIQNNLVDLSVNNTGNSTQNKEIDDEFIKRMVQKDVPFIESGFTDIDDCIGGFMPSTFTIIGGAPTMGKTTLILNMVNHVCGKLNKKVLFVSLEMSYIQLQAKLIAAITKVDSRNIINPRRKLSENELQLVNKGRQIIEGYNLYRMGNIITTTATIEEELRIIGDVDIIFIDYLQLLQPRYFVNSRYDRITQVSNELKRLSRKLNIPIVCVASINRAPSTRNSKRPQLSDLRDSGNIEYDVDTALLLHRESELRDFNPNKDTSKEEFYHEAEIHVAKNRFGEADVLIKLWWDPSYSRFRNVARPVPEPEQMNIGGKDE
jgi:replicative DNA helicase